jgi:hypothetical protein
MVNLFGRIEATKFSIIEDGNKSVSRSCMMTKCCLHKTSLHTLITVLDGLYLRGLYSAQRLPTSAACLLVYKRTYLQMKRLLA